jgi:hypothetical protein
MASAELLRGLEVAGGGTEDDFLAMLNGMAEQMAHAPHMGGGGAAVAAATVGAGVSSQAQLAAMHDYFKNSATGSLENFMDLLSEDLPVMH